MTFSQIKDKRLYEHIVEQVVDLLKANRFKEGDPLPPERSLAAELGISRSSLREALSALEILGIVEIKAGRGTYVRSIPGKSDIATTAFKFLEGVDNPRYSFEARMLIEPSVASLAAKRITPQQSTELLQIMREMADLIDMKAPVNNADKRLHILLGQATGNPVLSRMMEILCEIWFSDSSPWWPIKNRAFDAEGADKNYFQAHQDIVEAVVNRDPRSARNAMLTHIKDVEKNFIVAAKGAE